MSRKTRASDEGASDRAASRYEQQYAKIRKANQRRAAKRKQSRKAER